MWWRPDLLQRRGDRRWPMKVWALGAAAFAKKTFRLMPRMSSWHSNFGKTTTNPTRHLHPLQTGRHGKSHPRKSQRPSPGAWENPTIWMGDSRIRSFWRMKQKSRSGCYGQWTSVEFLYGGKGCMESRALFLFMEAVGTELMIDVNFDRIESLEFS